MTSYTYQNLLHGRIPDATGWAFLWDRTIPRGGHTRAVAGTYRPVPGELLLAEPARCERHGSVTPMFRRKQRPVRPPAPARIVLYLNGTRRELLPTDRVTDIARIARATYKLTGQPARLYCSGWDWTAPPEDAA